MPYLLLIIGILIFGYAVYKFLLKANAKQIASFIGMLAIMLFSGGMIYLAVTGRLHAAIAGIGALYPWVVAFHKWRKNKKAGDTNTKAADDMMTRKEALDILAQEAVIALDCQFCGASYQFDRADIQTLFGLGSIQ